MQRDDLGTPTTQATGLLLTYDDVARELAVSKRTIERLVADGDLAAVGVRGAKRIGRVELERYVEGLGEQRRDVAASVTGLRGAPLRRRPRRASSFREQLGRVA